MTRILQNKLLIPFVIVIAWFPLLYVSFLNDDFQILGFHAKGSFLSILAPFWQQDVSVFYWRPVGNMLHPLMVMIFGFNPLPFRILSLVLYSLCCWVLVSFIEETGVKKEAAVLTGLVFALVPSHTYQVAWIAEQGESIVTIFLLLSFNFYKKNRLLAVLFFTSAVLTKESAFMGIFIPVIYYVINRQKYNLNKVLRDATVGLLIIIVLQVYRYFIIGGTIFSSSNFESVNPVKWAANFLTYIPVSLVTPEFLEYLISAPTAMVIAFFLVVIVSISIYFFYNELIKLHPEKKKIFFAGLLWFLVFIIPALPKFMRWYVFTASAGLMLSLSVLFEVIQARKYFLQIILLLLVFLAIIDFSVMLKWKTAGDKMKEITGSFKVLNDKADLFVFAVPEKINAVPLMKLGIAETIRYASGVKYLNVYAPLRTEFYVNDSKVEIKPLNDSTRVFYINDGRFKNREGRSYTFVKMENFSYTEENIKIEIHNGIRGSTRSEAIVTFPVGMKVRNMFYNGTGFISF